MRSPFGIFRKHGMILTAGLVVLCMFAFIFSQYLQPQHLPALLGMFALGTIFYLLGQPSGNGGWFGAVGAVLGLVIVSFVPGFWGPQPAASTSVGELSEEELQTLIEKRQQASEFIGKVIRTGLMSIDEFIAQQQPSFLEQPAQMRRFYYQIYQDPYMSYLNRMGRAYAFTPLGNSRSEIREATVRDWVMAQEADDLGIRVSNATITEYLKKASNRKLSDTQFIEFREETGLSEADLYDLLRYQIKVKQYYALADPTHSFTASNLQLLPPEQLWEYYKRATVQQDMELIGLPVKDFKNQVADPSDAELTAFFETYKNRFPQGVITQQDGWTQPVEALNPEPAFGVPRKIKLAYFTAKIPLESSYNPSPDVLLEYYSENTTKYPNPSFNRPLEDDSVPEPLTPGGPAVAQKPKPTGGPAWAEKREYLDFHRAKEDVREDYIFDLQQTARLQNDRQISQLITKMNELSAAWLIEGEGHKTPQQISDALVQSAEKLGFDKSSYTVPEDAWTAEEMTDTKIGQAVEVDINPNPGPEERKATAATNGATVVFQMFENSSPQDLFQPNQAISRSEADTRYVYWKIEDHPADIPDWSSLTEQRRDEVKQAWKLFKARDLAQARAEEIREALAKYYSKKPAEESEDRDLQKALEELKLKTVSGDDDLNVQFVPSFQWLQPPEPRSQTPPRLGFVAGVPKAGEQFMETAFNKLEFDPDTEEGDVGVLVNADGTEYYVGKILRRQYGQAASLDGLREAYLRDTNSTPAMQTVAELQNRQVRELYEKWQRSFRVKYNISVTPPRER